MNNNYPTKESFLNGVKDHSIEIIKDEGLYRHIRYSRQNSWNMYFEIITWPGKLAYTGDMGSFIFSRIEDMFQFFRNDKLEINTGYWSEKVIAESIFGEGISEFSVEAFHEYVLADKCMIAIRDFSSKKITFYDFWEHNLKRKTYHYVWCCYALVWGINQYDKMKGDKI